MPISHILDQSILDEPIKKPDHPTHLKLKYPLLSRWTSCSMMEDSIRPQPALKQESLLA
jgi:hypothetical protein